MKSMLLWIVLAMAGPAMARAQAPTGPLDVVEAVRLALRQNFAYQRAEAGIGIAEGNRLDALAGLLPNASGSYSYSESDQTLTFPDYPIRISATDGSVVRTGPLGFDTHRDGSGFGATVREDLSLTSWYLYRSSQADVAGARHGKDAAAQNLAFEVRRQFYLTLRAQELLRVQQEDFRLAQDQERRTTSMFELGSVARVDVLKAKVRVSEAEVALIRQQNQVDVEKAHLATLLGLSVETPLELGGELLPEVTPFDSAQAVTESTTRPDLKSARETLRSAKNVHRAAVLSRVPGLFATFDVSASSGSETNDIQGGQVVFDPSVGDSVFVSYSVPGSKTDAEVDGWTLRVGASLTLDAFLNMGQHKRTRAVMHQAEYDLRGLELNVQREVQEAVLNLRASIKAIEAAQSGVASAEEDHRLSQERYQQGLGTVLELLEAQVNLTRARDTLVNALTGLRISEAGLDRARGASLPY